MSIRREALIRELGRDGDTAWLPCQVVDVSARDASVKVLADLDAGARVLVRLHTEDGVTPAFQLRATVVRAEQAALRQIEIDWDAMAALQRELLDELVGHDSGRLAGAA